MNTCQPNQDPAFGCKGEYCKSSPYCKTSWIETHKLMLRNLAYELTGKASSVGIIYAATYGPQLVVGVFAGAAADRYDRRHILILATVFQAVCTAAFGVLSG